MVIKITKQKKTVANQLRKSITLCLTTSLFLVACQSPKLASAVAPPQPALLKNPNQVNSEPLKTNQANVTIAKTLPELAIKLKQKYPQLQNKQNFQTQQTTEQPNAPQPNNVIVSSAPDGQVEISITTQSRLSVVAISGAQYVIFVGDTDGGFDPYVVGGSLLAPVTVKVYWNKTVPSNSFPFIPFPAPDGNYNVLSQGLYIRWDSLDPSAARCYDESRFLYEPYNVYMYRSAYKFFDELPSFIYNEQGEIVETIDRDSICTVNASPILITPFILPFIEPTPTLLNRPNVNLQLNLQCTLLVIAS